MNIKEDANKYTNKLFVYNCLKYIQRPLHKINATIAATVHTVNYVESDNNDVFCANGFYELVTAIS